MISTHYSMSIFHLMGSLVLSRSFHVERWQGGEDEELGAENHNGQADHSMNVDETEEESHAVAAASGKAENEFRDEDEKEEEEDGEEEDSSDIAMVPMADMLNARYQAENVSSREGNTIVFLS
jgi:N-lysine methyltransferase SETD6